MALLLGALRHHLTWDEFDDPTAEQLDDLADRLNMKG